MIVIFKEAFHSKDFKFLKLFVIAVISVLAWNLIPLQPGLSEKALHMVIIFVLTIAGIMLEVCPPLVYLFVCILITNLKTKL